ncbi:MAG: T9SS type A sorting domain-containing protein, partial [Thermoflexibacter sp.]|nr:T9SS type A sorting domain-containing protein [Thermoflexibacter sp.]
ANIGSFGTTSNSLVANNTRNNSRESRLISPIINTQNKAIVEINFDVSYKAIAQKADSLEIMVSMDCGDSFSTIWKRGGDFLGTTVPSLFRTNPRFDDWKRVKIYANINNSNTAQFIFKNLNKEGNSIYIDNIVIQSLNAEQVTVPQVDWVATPNFLLRNERSIIEENVQGVGVDLAWNFPNAVPNTSSERILYVQYPTQGAQNITLRANNLINQNTVSKPAIQVISGKKLSNINNKPLNIKTLGNNNYLAGHNFFRDNAKAEYFSDFGKYELLHGADIFFAYVELFNSLSEVTFTIWSEQDGKPSQILASQKVNFAEIKRDVIRRQPTRIILNNPIPAPESFFVGIQLNYSPFSNEKVAIYTAETLRNTGWELTNTNIWQRYDKPAVAKTAAVALSHAIFPIVSPEVGIYDKDFANRKVLLYPNPTNNSVKIDYEDIKILSCQIYNYLGQLVKNYDNVPENLAEINLSSLESGLYLIVFETDKGKAVKKLILYN